MKPTMKHSMHLKESPFCKIKNGYKTIELRLYDEKRRKICVGDQIEFTNEKNPNEKILARVSDIHLFESFDELYQNLDLVKCGYLKEELEFAKSSDMDAYYSKEEQINFGVVGLEFELIYET